ncbi:conserved membrane domain protein [Mycobacterium ulcerans str. Harvey]|uniref:Conserved membrane domain protein n=1 Tax=Mycobacterium ulcerans str. Harvey TaxID=1299332 RepID=A0ABN0R9I7_MYCUL|nr:conserved membrane domain protein [Mycobacterium ulcerans str. Harvey]
MAQSPRPGRGACCARHALSQQHRRRDHEPGGYPTACFSSIDRHKALSNYHQMSDTPDNVNYETVAHAVTVAESVVRELAR